VAQLKQQHAISSSLSS